MIQEIYNRTIRRYMPRTNATLNGVKTRRSRLLDASRNQPEYKHAAVEALRRHVTTGDSVTVIGGGWGVTSVVAARQVADVTTYEPGKEQCEIIEEAIKTNGVADSVEVKHSSVGPVYDAFGSSKGSSNVTPEELEDCDVLEMDCEGCEGGVVSNMDITPRVLIVEIHPQHGQSIEKMGSVTESMGYVIERTEYHENNPNSTIVGVIE